MDEIPQEVGRVGAYTVEPWDAARLEELMFFRIVFIILGLILFIFGLEALWPGVISWLGSQAFGIFLVGLGISTVAWGMRGDAKT